MEDSSVYVALQEWLLFTEREKLDAERIFLLIDQAGVREGNFPAREMI